MLSKFVEYVFIYLYTDFSYNEKNMIHIYHGSFGGKKDEA